MEAEVREDRRCYTVGFEVEEESLAKECRQLLEAGKDRQQILLECSRSKAALLTP